VTAIRTGTESPRTSDRAVAVGGTSAGSITHSGSYTSGTIKWATVAAGILVSVLNGTSTSAPLATAANVRWIAGVGTGYALDDGRFTVALPITTNPLITVPIDGATVRTVTEAEQVRWLHTASGLTWDQLGRVFGVSRRAVHLWANGGRMNAANAAKLAEFVAVVRELPARSPADARMRLHAAGPDGPSLLDTLRRRYDDSDINGSAFSPPQLLGARYEAEETDAS
jgi:hypothetical protein